MIAPMIAELPQNALFLALGTFLLGWILAAINSRLGPRGSSRKRDPRDDRIRSLEAEHRVAAGSVEDLKAKLEKTKNELETALHDVEKRDSVISHQQETLDKLRYDLKESVKKTRDLRAELSERATENLRSEVKQRELETELSVARASTDMLATGVLDYSMNDDIDDDLQEVFAESAFTMGKPGH